MEYLHVRMMNALLLLRMNRIKMNRYPRKPGFRGLVIASECLMQKYKSYDLWI